MMLVYLRCIGTKKEGPEGPSSNDIMSKLRLQIRAAHVELGVVNLLVEAELRQLEYKIMQYTLAQSFN